MTNDVQSKLREVRELLQRYPAAGLEAQLCKCEGLLAGRDEVDVAVVGRFKAGKSSLLNHLVGRAVLPSGVVPVTAVITRLGFAESESMTVHFSSGKSEQVAVEDVADYVSERGNPDNAKSVREVEVRTPALRRYGSLRLVDTPGLSSVLAHNTETARAWFPKLGAAILAVSVDAPLSDEDLRTLERLCDLTPKTALLLTKVDLLSATERDEVGAFVRQQVRLKFSGEVAVFEYSVRPGFEHLRQQFDDGWLLAMAHDYIATREQIAAHKLRAVARQLQSYLKVSIAMGTENAAAGDELKRKIAEERRRFGALQTEIEELAQRYAAKTIENSLRHFERFESAVTQELKVEFDAKSPEWRFAVPKLIETYREWLSEALARRLQALSEHEREPMCQPLVEMNERTSALLQSFRNRLGKEVHAALGIELTLPNFESEVEPPRAPSVSVGKVFDTPLDLLGYGLPTFVFGFLIRRRMRRALAREAEKNLSRLASEWSGRIGKAVHQVAYEAEVFADDQLAMIESATSRREDNLPGLRQDLSEVGSILRK